MLSLLSNFENPVDMAPQGPGGGTHCGSPFEEDSVVKASQDEKPSLRNLSSGHFGQPRQTANPLLESLGSPHVGSFNFMLDSGLNYAVQDLEPIEFSLEDGRRISLWIAECRIEKPSVPAGTVGVHDNRVYPSEARQRGSTYKGICRLRMNYAVDGVVQNTIEKSLGAVPIMLKSDACHLNGKIDFIKWTECRLALLQALFLAVFSAAQVNGLSEILSF